MFGMAGETEFDLRFQLFGIPVRVHPLFWVMAAFVIWNFTAGQLDHLFVAVLCVFVSILVHEFGHALTYRYYGYQGEVVLYMMGGYATGGRLSTWRSVLVSAAGPGAGFILFGIAWAVLKYGPPEWTRGNPYAFTALAVLVTINLYWGILNLIPCLPLDGGRIMEALVFRFWPRRAMNKVLWVSILSSAAVALYAGQHRQRFLLIFFGIMCAQHVIALNNDRTFR